MSIIHSRLFYVVINNFAIQEALSEVLDFFKNEKSVKISLVYYHLENPFFSLQFYL